MKFLSDSHPKQLSWPKWSYTCGYVSYSMKEIMETGARNDPDASLGTRERSDSGSYLGSRKEYIRRTWVSLVENYTSRQVSDENDKLPAISAIATMSSQLFKCDYLAGLWRDNLLYDLMWKTVYKSTYGRNLLTY
jgi:hypothetical protein